MRFRVWTFSAWALGVLGFRGVGVLGFFGVFGFWGFGIEGSLVSVRVHEHAMEHRDAHGRD